MRRGAARPEAAKRTAVARFARDAPARPRADAAGDDAVGIPPFPRLRDLPIAEDAPALYGRFGPARATPETAPDAARDRVSRRAAEPRRALMTPSAPEAPGDAASRARLDARRRDGRALLVAYLTVEPDRQRRLGARTLFSQLYLRGAPLDGAASETLLGAFDAEHAEEPADFRAGARGLGELARRAAVGRLRTPRPWTPASLRILAATVVRAAR